MGIFKGLYSKLRHAVLLCSFTPRPGVRLISLDCFDVSVLGRDPQEPQRRMAAELLARAHGTWDEECWEQTGELTGLDQRFVDSNGALSDAQLRWLDAELTRADALGEVAVVFGEHPLPSCFKSRVFRYQKVVSREIGLQGGCGMKAPYLLQSFLCHL